MSKITLIVEFAIKPGHGAAFADASARMRQVVAASEPGTLQYDWWLIEDGTRGINIEAFADSEALAFHMNNTSGLVGDLVEAADVRRVEVLGGLTEAGHAAIDEAASGHFRFSGGIGR